MAWHVLYCLEMRNTQQWEDVRYRVYTSSARKVEAFKRIPKLKFTDSGHGVVPHVTEMSEGKKRLPVIKLIEDYVRENTTAKEAKNGKV